MPDLNSNMQVVALQKQEKGQPMAGSHWQIPKGHEIKPQNFLVKPGGIALRRGFGNLWSASFGNDGTQSCC